MDWSWSAFGSAVVGGVLTFLGSMVFERFRAVSAAKFGLAQAKWEMRRDTYVKLLTLLQQVQLGCQLLGLEARRRGGEASHESASRVLELARELGPARAVLPLWLSDASLRALEASLAAVGPVPDGRGVGTEFWQEMARNAGEAGKAIAQQARKDLQINLP